MPVSKINKSPFLFTEFLFSPKLKRGAIISLSICSLHFQKKKKKLSFLQLLHLWPFSCPFSLRMEAAEAFKPVQKRGILTKGALFRWKVCNFWGCDAIFMWGDQLIEVIRNLAVFDRFLLLLFGGILGVFAYKSWFFLIWTRRKAVFFPFSFRVFKNLIQFQDREGFREIVRSPAKSPVMVVKWRNCPFLNGSVQILESYLGLFVILNGLSSSSTSVD